MLHFTDLDMKLVIIRSNATSRYFLNCVYDGGNFEIFLLNSKCFGNCYLNKNCNHCNFNSQHEGILRCCIVYVNTGLMLWKAEVVACHSV